jgi:Leucine-rich repeat (LRR) protein
VKDDATVNRSNYLRLVSQVRDNLDDESSLQVLADTLIEMGNIQGELLNLVILKNHIADEDAGAKIVCEINRLIEKLSADCWSTYRVRIAALDKGNPVARGLTTFFFPTDSGNFSNPLFQIPTIEEVLLLFPLATHIKCLGFAKRDMEPMCFSAFWKVISDAQLNFSVPSSFGRFGQEAPLGSLQSLKISGILGDCISTLFDNDHLGTLRSLDVSDNSLGKLFVRKLHACTTLTQLQRLNLAGNSFSKSDYHWLATAPVVEKLVHLDLSYSSKHSNQLVNFFSSLRKTTLRSLHLNNCDLTEDCMARLAASTGMSGILHLDLKDTRLTNRGIRYLIESSYLRQLESLDISDNELTDATLAILERGLPWPNLKQINMNFNRYQTQVALERLCQHPSYAHVKIIV